jgi:hypothetical protein
LLRRVTAGVVDPYPPIIAASVLQHCPRESHRYSQRRVAAPPLPGLAHASHPLLARPPETCRPRHFLDMRLVPPVESEKMKHIRVVGHHQRGARRQLPASLGRSAGPPFVRGPSQFYRIVSSGVCVLIDAGTALLFVLPVCRHGNETRSASRGVLAA